MWASLLAWPLLRPGTLLRVRLARDVWIASRRGARNWQSSPKMTKSYEPIIYTGDFDGFFEDIDRASREELDDGNLFRPGYLLLPLNYPYPVLVFA